MPRKKRSFPLNLPHTPNVRSDFWAFLCFIAFPVAMLAATRAGASASLSFVLGAASTLFVLILNVVGERHVWMFDPVWHKRFSHPEFSFRLALFSGVILIVVETTLLLFFVFDPALDRTLLELVFWRQCVNPTTTSMALCDLLRTVLSPS